MKNKSHSQPLALWVKLTLALLSLFLLLYIAMSVLVYHTYGKKRLQNEAEALADTSTLRLTKIREELNLPKGFEIERFPSNSLQDPKRELIPSKLNAEQRRIFIKYDYLIREITRSGSKLSYQLPEVKAPNKLNRLNETNSLVHAMYEIKGPKTHRLIATHVIHINDTFFYLYTSGDITELDQELLSLRQTFTLYALPFFPILMALLYAITKHFTRDLKKLSLASAEYKAGAVIPALDVHSSAETKQLATQFTAMWKKINEQYTRILEENERKEQFVLALNHEYKTPLSSLLLHLNLLENPGLSAKQRSESLCWMKHSAEELEKMRQKIMALYLEKDTVEFKPLALVPFLRKWIDKFPSDCRILLHAEVSDEWQIRSDDYLLSLLLKNLCDNAKQAFASSSKDAHCEIHIEVTSRGLVIMDNGPGVPLQTLDRLTETFFRLDPIRSRNQKHYGLGLSLCAHICRIHDWSLTFSLAEHGGLRVEISFSNQA